MGGGVACRQQNLTLSLGIQVSVSLIDTKWAVLRTCTNEFKTLYEQTFFLETTHPLFEVIQISTHLGQYPQIT